MTMSRLNEVAAAAHARGEDDVAALAKIYERSLQRAAGLAGRAFESLTAAAAWQPPPEGNVLAALSVVATGAALRARRLHARLLTAVADETSARLGIAWDVKHPLAAALLDKAAGRTGERLGLAVQPVLRATIAAAYDAGLSVPDASALIQQTLAAAAPWQADMLARTDLNGLANGGSLIAARLAGAPFKTWLATNDDRTRETHAEADGQTVPVDQPFTVGGEQLDFPGDPAGSDAECANCRCFLVYSDSLAASAAAPTRTRGGTMTKLRPAARPSAKKAARSLAAAAMPEVRWRSDLAFEGKPTGDGRYILPGALTTRELPLTLMAQTVTDDGHDGAFVAGRIDKANRSSKNIDGDQLPAGVKSYQASGVFDMGGPNGAEVARLVGDETVRGVSVDLAVLDWAIRDPETGELTDPADATSEQMDLLFFGELEFAVRKGEIMAATVCPTPAFADARIALAASAGSGRVLRLTVPFMVDPGSLVAAAAPARPPRAWFETSEPPGKMPLTITDEGRVFGHIATWDTCHTGLANVCTTPPRSRSGYSYFHTGEVETADGKTVPVGKLMLASKGGKHAPLSASQAEASRHYDDTSMVAAHIRATDGKHGIWVAGALNPLLTAERVRELRTLPPSGDWREVNGRLELIAALAVPVPGFPVPRAEAALLAAGEETHLSSLVASSGIFEAAPVVVRALEQAGLVTGAARDLDVRTRALLARAEGGVDALVELAAAPAEATPPRRAAVVSVEDVGEQQPEPAAGGDAEPSLDEQLEEALGTLAHVTDMAARLQSAEQRASEMAVMVETARDEHREETAAQKRETLAVIDSLTARIAAGEQISEAMLSAMNQLTERKPRTVKVVRDEDGRAVAYEEATA